MQLFSNIRSAPITAKIGICVICAYAFIATFASQIAPYSETGIVGGSYEPWFGEFYLGTDNLGRDMVSRLIYGAQNTVGIAFATTMLAFALGAGLGILAALAGGWLDQVLSRIVDLLFAIPSLIFALLFITVFADVGAVNLGLFVLDERQMSIVTLVIVIAVIDSTVVFRLTRAVANDIMVLEYIEVARLRGERTWWLIFREVLPNARVPLAAEFGLRFNFVFLFIAALSFLGLGLQPPTADWGSMVRQTANLIMFAKDDVYLGLTPLLPAAAVAMLTISINFVVDWVVTMSGSESQP